MNQYEKALFLSLLAFYFPALGLYHFMIVRVNRHLPPDRRIPHSLSWGDWNRLGTQYKARYPKSFVYQLTLSCAATILILAVTLLTVRLWEYLSGK